jgi:PGF-pre-PGF domain-containing protein
LFHSSAGAGTQPIETLTVNHSIVDSDIENVTFTFRVDRAGVDPSTVALYRQDGENWTRLPTRSVGRTNDSYYF